MELLFKTGGGSYPGSPGSTPLSVARVRTLILEEPACAPGLARSPLVWSPVWDKQPSAVIGLERSPGTNHSPTRPPRRVRVASGVTPCTGRLTPCFCSRSAAPSSQRVEKAESLQQGEQRTGSWNPATMCYSSVDLGSDWMRFWARIWVRPLGSDHWGLTIGV